MFFLGLNCKIKENNRLGLVSTFILFSSLLLTATAFTPSASAFINQNLLGLSPNLPGTIAPISPQIGSPYPGYGGGYGGRFWGNPWERLRRRDHRRIVVLGGGVVS